MKNNAKSLLNLSKGKRIDLINFSNFDKIDCFITFNQIKDLENMLNTFK